MASSRYLYGPLVKKAVILVERFEASKQHLDDFTADALKEMKKMDAMEQTFILGIVTGCVEHKRLLEKVIQAFYAQNWKNLIKDDRNQYFTICYIAMFALEDLGFQNFCDIVKSLDINKMHKFLSFFFDETNLTTQIQDAWSLIYDADYVESNWIAPLLRWRPQVQILLDQLARISAGTQVTKDSMKSTVPKEFSFSKPRLRPVTVPETESIPQPERNPPVPDSTYLPPKELEAMEEIKVKNRKKAEQMLYEANMEQFKFANPNKSKHTLDRMSKIREEFESNLTLYSSPSSGVMAKQKTNCAIKLNNAAIVREGALYNRKMEEDLQKLERLVQGEHAPSTFPQSQETLQRDLQKELAHIQRRHLEGCISHEEAVIARLHIMERNQKAMQLNTEEANVKRNELVKIYAQKRFEEEREMKDLIRQVSDGHANAKAARVRLQEFKQRIVKEVSEQNRELLCQALEDAQSELRRKFETIREIHAMESVPHIRHKFVDKTKTGGHGLLEEMSLAELRERLVYLKKGEECKVQQRREHLQQERQAKKLLLQDQMEANNLHRSEAARWREEEKMTKQRLLERVAMDEEVLALKKKLEETKQESKRMKDELKMKSKPAQWNPPKVKSWIHVPKKIQNWEDLERCLEDHIKMEDANQQPTPRYT